MQWALEISDKSGVSEPEPAFKVWVSLSIFSFIYCLSSGDHNYFRNLLSMLCSFSMWETCMEMSPLGASWCSCLQIGCATIIRKIPWYDVSLLWCICLIFCDLSSKCPSENPSSSSGFCMQHYNMKPNVTFFTHAICNRNYINC